MKIQVSATRMELMRLKKRLLIARRGHKLLKDKQDELMRKFLELIQIYKNIRTEVENNLNEFYEKYYIAISEYSEDTLKTFFVSNFLEFNFTEKYTQIMNLKLPELNIELNGEFNSIGGIKVNLELDYAIMKLKQIISKMVKLAEIENNVKELAFEIEKTRRRVNALEYVLIPNLEETIRYISMKIGEMERSNLTRLMKIKEIVEKH